MMNTYNVVQILLFSILFPLSAYDTQLVEAA